MKKTCSYVATNSANATLVACTKAGYFCGANLGGGIGTLTILDGTASLLTLKTTATLDTVHFVPAIPVAFRTSLLSTMSGTGVCTLFFATTP